MNIFLYVILFIIFSPKFFFLLAGKSTASVTLGEILLNAFLFVLAVYVAEYLTHRFHILETFENNGTKKREPFANCTANKRETFANCGANKRT
jgi:hypothetical protein